MKTCPSILVEFGSGLWPLAAKILFPSITDLQNYTSKCGQEGAMSILPQKCSGWGFCAVFLHACSLLPASFFFLIYLLSTAVCGAVPLSWNRAMSVLAAMPVWKEALWPSLFTKRSHSCVTRPGKALCLGCRTQQSLPRREGKLLPSGWLSHVPLALRCRAGKAQALCFVLCWLPRVRASDRKCLLKIPT